MASLPRLLLIAALGLTSLVGGAALAEAPLAVPVGGPPAAGPGAAASPSSGSAPGAANNDAWGVGRSVVALNLGMGSAVGFVGATYAYSPVPLFETEAGIGLGLSGIQLSAMEKLTAGGSTTHFIAGVGLAYSIHLKDYGEHPAPSWWLNVDVAGIEVRTKTHFAFSLSAGLTAGDEPILFDASVLPQVRMGLGGWF